MQQLRRFIQPALAAGPFIAALTFLLWRMKKAYQQALPISVERQLPSRFAHDQNKIRAISLEHRPPFKKGKTLIWRIYKEVENDRLLAVAAGVVFYGLLALFPAITAIVSLYGLIATPSVINDHLGTLTSFLPMGAVDIIHEQVLRLTSKSDEKLSFAALFATGLAL